MVDWRDEDDREAATPAPSTIAKDVGPSLVESMFAGVMTKGFEALVAGGGHPAVIDVPAPTDEEAPLAEWVASGLPKYASQDPAHWPQQTVTELVEAGDGALGDYLEHLPPGPRLANVLDHVDVDAVDDFSLVEVVAAYKRMEAWSAAQAASAAAALAERDALNPTWPGSVPGRTRGECVAGQELAMRLRISRMTAIEMAACGRGFKRMFAQTGQALKLGLIDYPRARAIVTALQDLPTDVAMAAQWDVLDKAPGRTLRQVQHDLAQAIIAVDPDSADERHRAARHKRRVNHPRPLPDGMAHISAIMPAADAIALDTALEAAARAARNNGDQRNLDQLRCDTLALMGHTALTLGHIGPHPTTGCTCGCTPHDTRPTPENANHPAPDSHGEHAAHDAHTSDEDGRSASDGAAVPAAGAAPAPSPADRPPPPPSPADGPPYPGHRLPRCALPTIRLGMIGGGRADIRITIPLGVLLADPDAPPREPLIDAPEPVAELEGYGPVPPVIARALAAGNTWRRLITDPTGTQVLDVGRTRYQPPAAIADHVRERDRTCISPSCSTPARSCDLDHEHEWHLGGRTSADNLGPLCKRDHPTKSIGAFTVAHATDRTYAWTTPTGHGYLRRPDGTTITMPRRTAEGLRAAAKEAERTGTHPDPATVDAVLAEISAGTDITGTWTPPLGAPTPTWPGTPHAPSWADDEPPF